MTCDGEFSASEKEGWRESMKIGESVSFLSELYHLVAFTLKKPKTQLETGMLITSIDVDVGAKELGTINKGKNDANVNARFNEYSVGKIEEQALPLFVDLFNAFEMPATFAIRGQLVEVSDSAIELLTNSTVKHDIGAHGYYHRQFKELSGREAENELSMISVNMKKFGITPKSFVFPKNSVAHLDLLEKFGYRCYRSYGDFRKDCMYIEKRGQLYDVHPSLYIDRGISSILLRKILDVAVARRAPFHIWFHLWNLGETKESTQKSINRIIYPLLKHAKKKLDCGELAFETMLSAAEKTEAHGSV